MVCHEQPGVSIVICCYNSAFRLPETLKHLTAQEVPASIPWEVIVIDNASTDKTAQVAKSPWAEDTPVPLKVISEPEIGLINARKRGFSESRYEVVSFVDDDNWVAPNWVRLVSEIMSGNPEVGACGGQIEAVFETDPPFWFNHFKHQFVVGVQGDTKGDVTDTRGHLWGAGITIRKRAWEELLHLGFQPLLTGRKGNMLISGEDYEICYAFRLAGWRLWYDPELRLRHYMPAIRINWTYLRRLNRGHGITRVGFEPYEFALKNSVPDLPKIFGRIWIWQTLKTFGKIIIWHGWDWISSLWTNKEGDARILGAEYHFGRFFELLCKRKEYDQNVIRVWHAEWIKK
jgi:glycosyltransferase involved in cell wall biosynthesis